MTTETGLIAFKAICNFINDLADEFGKKHIPLVLYRRLINKTQIAHDRAINKNISLFQDFCVANRTAIMSQNANEISQDRVQYSDKVFIDLKYIFTLCDAETGPVVWKHLLTLSAILDPVSKAKEILKQAVKESKSGEKEAEFLTTMMSKVQNHVKPDSNPMEAISTIMSSGLITDMMSNMQNGQLDLSKLLGAVQSMVGNMQESAGDDPEARQAVNMLNNMVGSLSNPNGPDMGGLMQMMTTMMSGMPKGAEKKN